jgi:hypothetical protein
VGTGPASFESGTFWQAGLNSQRREPRSQTGRGAVGEASLPLTENTPVRAGSRVGPGLSFATPADYHAEEAFCVNGILLTMLPVETGFADAAAIIAPIQDLQ